jgi:hypothetical protein
MLLSNRVQTFESDLKVEMLFAGFRAACFLPFRDGVTLKRTTPIF